MMGVQRRQGEREENVRTDHLVSAIHAQEVRVGQAKEGRSTSCRGAERAMISGPADNIAHRAYSPQTTTRSIIIFLLYNRPGEKAHGVRLHHQLARPDL
jgi:hypothetical protein